MSNLGRSVLAAVFAGAFALLLATVVQTASAQQPADQPNEPPGPQIELSPCPAPQPLNGVDLCVNRGDGSTYNLGDPITICASVNVPQIAIFPPPPPPQVRVVDSVNGGPERVILQDAFNGASRCVSTTIGAPTGAELMRADVLSDNGQVIATDTVQFTSVGAPGGQPDVVTAGVTVDRGPNSAYRIGEVITVCATAAPADGVSAHPVRLLDFSNGTLMNTFDLGTFAGTRCYQFFVTGPAGWGTLQVDVLSSTTGAVLSSSSVSYFAS